MAGREEITRLLKMKERVERRIGELKDELGHQEHLLKLVEREITDKSFKIPERPTPPLAPTPTPPPRPPPPTEPLKTAPPPSVTPEQVFPLRAADGQLLGNIHLRKGEMRMVPAGEIRFDVNTPPFQQFLVTKVLMDMVAKDREDASAGLVGADEILSYRVVEEDDLLKEVVIRNYRDEKRVVKLRNSIRWTLEKMWEKTRPDKAP